MSRGHQIAFEIAVRILALVLAHVYLLALGMTFLVLLLAGSAWGFPETVREAYLNCGTCHLSPSGGGALHNYGRTAGQEFATFAPKDSGGLLFGTVPLHDRLVVGGDFRYIDIRLQGGEQRAFTMQSDVELAFKFSKEVWVSASYGLYGEAKLKEYRRSYVLWTPFSFYHMRFGKFTPAYGLNFPDHTLATRGPLGLGQGSETYNVETGLHGNWGEILVTGIAGDGTTITFGDPNYDAESKDAGGAARLAVNVAKRAQVGASVMRIEGADSTALTAGGFVSWGITSKLYLLAEADRKQVDDELPLDVSFAEIGYEVIRGLHLQATHEHLGGNVPGAAVQWFPVPHVELLARAKHNEGAWNGAMLIHYYW